MSNNARIWMHADTADRLADLVQRRMFRLRGEGADFERCYDVVTTLRADLAAIKQLSNDRLANDKAGGA